MKKYLSRFALIICGLTMSVDAFADNSYVGKVLDESGAPLAGAVVKAVKGKDMAVTDVDGVFELPCRTSDALKVTISYIGYNTEEFILRPCDKAAEQILRMVPDMTSLDEVVVTATRTPKSLKDVPVVTRVISADDIKKADATNIQDLLTDELPGLEFSYAMSQETAMNMNGFGGNAILFLVDGERLAGETMDNVDYSRLNLGNVGQIEIVKGASSALYGANAVGGVVNLITRESKEPWTLNVNSRYRSAGNEWRSGGELNFNAGRFNSNTSVQYTTAETIKLTDAFDTKSSIHEIYGGHSLNIKERLTYYVNDNLRFIARGGYFARVSNRSNYDDHYKDYSGGLKSVWNVAGKQNLEVSYSYDQYDKSRYVGGIRTHDHDYSNRQHIVHGLYTRFFGQNVLTVGGDYMHDYLTTYQFAAGEKHTQHSVDLFAQFDYNPLDWLNIIGSLREDYFSASRNNSVTARVAAMAKTAPVTVRASYAGGFRAPTLKEMYMNFDMAGIQMIYGNPDLKPETSHNFSVSLERSALVSWAPLRGSYSVNISGFYNNYDSRITTMDYPGDAEREAGAMYCNEDGVKVAGLDVNLRYRLLMGLGASASYNYLHMSGRTIDSQFSNPRPHSATWRLDYDKQICSEYKIYAAISGRYMSKPESRYETDGAYSLWKFTLQQRVWKGINVNLMIENLFDYRPEVYYWNSAPTTGRTYSVGLSLDVDAMFK